MLGRGSFGLFPWAISPDCSFVDIETILWDEHPEWRPLVSLGPRVRSGPVNVVQLVNSNCSSIFCFRHSTLRHSQAPNTVIFPFSRVMWPPGTRYS